MNKVSIISKMMNFTELYSMINIIDIYQEKKVVQELNFVGHHTLGKLQKKWMLNFFRNVKIKSPNFWQNYFFLESYTIELTENDDSTY